MPLAEHATPSSFGDTGSSSSLQMENASIRLKEIFLENNVSNMTDLRELSPRSFERLDASVYGWFSAFRKQVVSRLAGMGGLNLCLGLKRNAADFALGAPLEMIVKKLSFFSGTGILLTQKFSAPGKSRRAIPDIWYYLALNYLPLIQSGALTVLPKGAALLVDEGAIRGETFIIKSRQPHVVLKNWFLMEEEIPSLQIVDISERALREQLVESHPHYGLSSGKPIFRLKLVHPAGSPRHHKSGSDQNQHCLPRRARLTTKVTGRCG